MKRIKLTNQQGFTIVELMIATIVFTMVLLVCTSGLLQISRLYYRGTIASRTQETTRTILEDVAESIKLGGGTVVPSLQLNNGVTGSCAGGKRYSYNLYKQMDDTVPSKRHVLMVDPLAACSSGSYAQDINAFIITGKEMMNDRMRLAVFQICVPGPTPACPDAAPATSNLYKVTIRVATGEDDLFTDRNGDGAITANDAPLECKSQRAGSQFCAVSELSTVVQKRL